MALNDDEFLGKFENCTIDSFHHNDHVKAAFLYLSRYPALEALRRFSESLQRFAAAKGKPQLYHETITWAFVFLIRERMGFQNWEEFAAANGDLLDWKNNILKKYYRAETLSSDRARSTFLFPDALD
jgi:hypothetical protein